MNAAEDRLNSGTPFDGVLMRGNISFVTNNSARSSLVTWRAAKETFYRVESTTSLQSGWGVVTNLFNANQVNSDFTYTNSIPTNATMQFFRIGYTP